MACRGRCRCRCRRRRSPGAPGAQVGPHPRRIHLPLPSPLPSPFPQAHSSVRLSPHRPLHRPDQHRELPADPCFPRPRLSCVPMIASTGRPPNGAKPTTWPLPAPPDHPAGTRMCCMSSTKTDTLPGRCTAPHQHSTCQAHAPPRPHVVLEVAMAPAWRSCRHRRSVRGRCWRRRRRLCRTGTGQ